MYLFGLYRKELKRSFLLQKVSGKMIEYTDDAAEIIFSLFKPQYKVMKQFETPEGAQAYLHLFILRHNFRVFSHGKRKRFPPAQLEGWNVSLDDWSDLLYSGDEAIPEEALFLSEEVKDAIFSESVT